jgi:hypothetical protein
MNPGDRNPAAVVEPFVSADAAAQFLSIGRRFLLSLARRGIAGAYPVGTGEYRRRWIFRLSELAAAITWRGSRCP